MLQRNDDRWLLVNIVGLLLCGFLHEKSIVSDEISDGFTVGVRYVSTTLEKNGLQELLHEELGAVHLVRFLSVYPIYWLHENGNHHVFQYAILAALMIPLLAIRFGNQRHILQPLFIYLPLFLSFRAVLVICSISYLFIILFSRHRSYVLLALSALFANLSSGTVVAWVAIAVLNCRRLLFGYRLTYIVCVAALSLSLYSSLSHKRVYFDDIRTLNMSRVQTMILQNTMLESYRNGQYARLTVYSLMLLAGLGILSRSLFDKTMSRELMMFYLVSIAGFLVEGLSVLGFIVPVFWYYVGVRPDWGTKRLSARARHGKSSFQARGGMNLVIRKTRSTIPHSRLKSA